jgi:hypothetical protein
MGAPLLDHSESAVMTSPDLSKQPVLIIEIPWEIVDRTTALPDRYYQQKPPDLEETVKASCRRWRFIGKIFLVYSAVEQVRP